MMILLVAFARVYYRCHWIGDTIIGIMLGMTVGYFSFINFRDIAEMLIQPLPTAIFKFTL
jgi:membrane-associated phospholipid phosphatase